MSLFDAMRTSVTGMNAQSMRINSVSENISNTSTTGYKSSNVEFETLVQNFSAGSVESHARRAVSEQGTLKSTSSVTDLAINGNGFFVVANKSGTPFMTRAGSFVPDNNGDLINTAGFKLMGYDLTKPGGVTAANGASGLVGVNVNQRALVATPSTTGQFTANLPSTAGIVAAANLPSANVAGSSFTAKSSLVSYDNLGGKVNLDIYLSKTATNTWEATIFDGSTAATGGGFPYTSGPLVTQSLTFDPANGKLAAASPSALNVSIPNGATLNLDIGKTTQLSASYQVVGATVNGNAPSTLDHIEIANDGTLSTIYGDGTRISTYQIPLASVVSVNNLTSLDGNVFSESLTSGSMRIGVADLGGMGKIVSNTLENSSVDLASELTTMIEAQRSYTSNSKVFQAGADLLQVLEQLRSN